MNFYNPYYIPRFYTSKGFFSNLFKGVNFTSILNGTQKTLNVVNQAIPIFKEMSPIVKNAKTMFRVASEFSKNNTDDSSQSKHAISNNSYYKNVPTFFE